jgi:hypothetical protein
MTLHGMNRQSSTSYKTQQHENLTKFDDKFNNVRYSYQNKVQNIVHIGTLEHILDISKWM